MAEYKHGDMDIKEQEKTFDGFMGLVTKSVIVIVLFLIFLAMVNG